jgi:tRNA pseudouridine38-40 synthase
MKYIYSHIASTEYKEGTVGLWLHSLNHRNYPDLRSLDEEGVTNDKKTEIDTDDKKTEIEAVTE